MESPTISLLNSTLNRTETETVGSSMSHAVLIVAYSSVIVVSVAGNGIVILSVITCRRMRNDLISLLILFFFFFFFFCFLSGRSHQYTVCSLMLRRFKSHLDEILRDCPNSTNYGAHVAAHAQ